MSLWAWWTFLVAANIADHVLTNRALAAGHGEINPLMVGLVGTPLAAAAVKAAALAAVGGAIAVSGRREPARRLMVRGVQLAAAWYGFVLLWHLIIRIPR